MPIFDPDAEYAKYDHVPVADACPHCLEDRVDFLIIDTDTDTVYCTTCHIRYSLKR